MTSSGTTFMLTPEWYVCFQVAGMVLAIFAALILLLWIAARIKRTSLLEFIGLSDEDEPDGYQDGYADALGGKQAFQGFQDSSSREYLKSYIIGFVEGSSQRYEESEKLSGMQEGFLDAYLDFKKGGKAIPDIPIFLTSKKDTYSVAYRIGYVKGIIAIFRRRHQPPT